MKNVTHSNNKLSQGFSLFEALMVVAILGIITAIAVPMMNNEESFYAARDRRNAQELVNTSMMASAAGLDFIQGDSAVEEILRAVSRGAMVTRGPLKGRSFSVPGLSDEDILGAAKYVRYTNGELHYTPDAKTTQYVRPGTDSFSTKLED